MDYSTSVTTEEESLLKTVLVSHAPHLPGSCVSGFSSMVVDVAVMVEGAAVPAAFMSRMAGVLALFAGSNFTEVFLVISAGKVTRPVM